MVATTIQELQLHMFLVMYFTSVELLMFSAFIAQFSYIQPVGRMLPSREFCAAQFRFSL